MTLLARCSCRVLVALSSLLLVQVVPRASAAEPAANARSVARALGDEAANSYARGDFTRAHELLERAYQLVPAPTIAVLNARALVALGRYLEAKDRYRAALARPLSPSAPLAFRRAIEQAKSELSTLEPRIPRLRVLVRGSRAAALTRVSIDDREIPAGRIGATIPVDPAIHSIRAEFGDGPIVTENVPLRDGQSRTVVIEAKGERESAARLWGFVGFGVGGAGILAGIAAGSVAMNARSEADRGCPDQRCEAGSAGASALDRFRSYRTVSTIGYAAGIAGIGLGTLLIVSAPEQPSASMSVAATLGGLRIEGAL